MEIIIARDGAVRFVYSDALAGLLSKGEARTARASHVEPGPGGWFADLAPVRGPKLGPFGLRQEALDAEVRWLTAHEIPVPGAGGSQHANVDG